MSRIHRSPSHRSRIPRTIAVILFGLQAFVWGGGSMLEARAAAESLAQVAHVEDEGSTQCPPIHSHLDCLVCRAFSSGAVTSHARDLVPTADRSSAQVACEVVRFDTDDRFGSLGSRAPPAIEG